MSCLLCIIRHDTLIIYIFIGRQLMNEQEGRQEITISIIQILRILKKFIVPILIITVVAAGIVYLIESIFVKPKYEASAMIYVQAKKMTDDSQVYSTSDLSVAKQLVDTYSIILKTDEVLEDVATMLNHQVTVEQLYKSITAKSVNNTEIFSINYQDTNPERARDVINALAEIAPERIKDVVKAGEASVVQKASTPKDPVSPRKMRDAAIAAVAGLVGSSFIFVLIAILDTRIRSVEDLTENFNFPVLGSIPTISADMTAAEKEEKEDE